MSITIHIAEDQEAKEEIYRFRYRIRGMSLSGHDPNVDHTNEWICDPADESARIIYAVRDGRIVGTMRLNVNIKHELPKILSDDHFTKPLETKLKTGHVAVVSRFVTDPRLKGETLVSLLFGSLFKYCLKTKVMALFHRGENDFLHLYQRLGYRSFYRHRGGKQTPMILCVRDLKHLNKIMSPFSMALKSQHDDHGKTAGLIAKIYGDFQLEPNVMPSKLATFWAELADHYARRHQHRQNIFDGMTPAQVSFILQHAKRDHYRAGDIIPAPAESGNSVGTVLRGKIADSLPQQNGYRFLEIFNENDAFGKTTERAGTDASQLIALEDCEVAILPQSLTQHLKHFDPLLATRYTMNLIAFLENRDNDINERIFIEHDEEQTSLQI